MSYTIAAILYVPALVAVALLVGAAALVARTVADAPRSAAVMAVCAALLTWGATLWLLMEGLPVRWLHALSIGAWLLLSIEAAALVLTTRPPAAPEEPAQPPPAASHYQAHSRHIRVRYASKRRRP